MPFKGLEELPGVRVPDAERIVPTRAHEVCASGIETHIVDRPLVSRKNFDDFSRIRIPQSHEFVFTARCDHLSVGAEADVLNVPLMVLKCC